MTFKEMVDEFMLKWKIVSEQKDELTNSYHALQEEGIVLRERLRAEWTKEVEEATGQLTKHYEQTIKLVTAKAKNNQASWELLSAKLQAEAYEREELAAIQTTPPTPTEQNDEPPIEDTTDARQEGHAPAEGPPEHTNMPPTVPEPVATEVSSFEATPPQTVPEPVAPEDSSLGDTTPPAPTTQPPSPTPHPDHPAHTPDPQTILDILEEE